MVEVRNAHPKLKRPLVAEAVFEVRFVTPRPYGVWPGRLFDRLQPKFSETEELSASQLPPQIGPPNVIRQRFRSADGSWLVQVGTGVITLNTTAYPGYEEFSEACESLQEAMRAIELKERVTRLGLRYVNRAPLDRSVEQIVSFEVDAPGPVREGLEALSSRWVSAFGSDGHLALVLTHPVEFDGEPHLVLDLDFFSEFEKPHDTRPSPGEWRERAHERVYEVFRASVNPEYLLYLEGTDGE